MASPTEPCEVGGVIVLGVEIHVMAFDVDLASANVALLHEALLDPLPRSPVH